MQQVYWACFEGSETGAAPGIAARAVSAEALSAPGQVGAPAEWSGTAVCAAGSGFEAYPVLAQIPGIVLTATFGHLRPRAFEIAQLAALDGLGAAVTAEQAQPVYLRDEVATLPARN